MSFHIEAECPDCGNVVKAPESAAGGTARCAACGAAVPIAEPVYDAEVVLDSRDLDDFDRAAEAEQRDEGAWPEAPRPPEPNGKHRRPCPMCGEMIVAGAVRCRYCGEVFEPSLRRPYSPPDAWESGGQMTGLDWVLCVLCPGIGCIVGIVACVRGDSTRCGKMIAFGLLFGVVWNIVRATVENMNP